MTSNKKTIVKKGHHLTQFENATTTTNLSHSSTIPSENKTTQVVGKVVTQKVAKKNSNNFGVKLHNGDGVFI